MTHSPKRLPLTNRLIVGRVFSAVLRSQSFPSFSTIFSQQVSSALVCGITFGPTLLPLVQEDFVEPFLAWPETYIDNETKEVANDKERCATYFAPDHPAAVRCTRNIQG